MANKIRDEIQMWEELARERNILKQSFLKEREQRQVRDEQILQQASPIVKPIVEAIAKTKSDIADQNNSLSSDELREYVDQIVEHYNIPELRRREFINAVREMYSNEQLFNVFLALTKADHIPPFGPDKMAKLGKVDSLIFYGTGGTNLDYVPGARSTPEFIARRKKFDTFYRNNIAAIDSLFATGNRSNELIDQIGEEYEDEEYDDEEYEEYEYDDVNDVNDTMGNGSNVGDESEQEGQLAILGSGLDELSERLSTIRAAQHAGNTSLDIINEAHDILRAILKSGKINKPKYQQLKNLFEDYNK